MFENGWYIVENKEGKISLYRSDNTSVADNLEGASVSGAVYELERDNGKKEAYWLDGTLISKKYSFLNTINDECSLDYGKYLRNPKREFISY